MRAFGLPDTFSLPKSLKIPITPWYTLLNFWSILLYKNVRPYMQYDLPHSSIFLNRSYFLGLDAYAGIRQTFFRRKFRVRKLLRFVQVKNTMEQ